MGGAGPSLLRGAQGLAGGGRGPSHINPGARGSAARAGCSLQGEEREPQARARERGPAATTSLVLSFPSVPPAVPFPVPWPLLSWGYQLAGGTGRESSRRLQRETHLVAICLLVRASLPAPSQDAQGSGAPAAAAGRPVPGDSGALHRSLEEQEAGSANRAAPDPRGCQPEQA